MFGPNNLQSNISDVFIGICCGYSLDLTQLELIEKQTLKIIAAADSGDII